MVSAYIFSSYFYSDFPHEHSVVPGSLRRKQFLHSSCRVILKHAQQWYYAAVTHVGVLQVMKGLNNNFYIARLETELWAIMGFQYLLNFSMVHKKFLIYNKNCYSSRDLSSCVPWREMDSYV